MHVTEPQKKTLILDEIEVPANLNFLIVEDEQDVQGLLKDHLLELGFEGSITVCDSAEEALEIAKERIEEKGPIGKFDFIISDWNLKGVSGLDLLIEIKNIPSYQKTPFLMVTANDNVSGMLVATKKGASEYLVKPWDDNEIASKIAQSWDKK